ncbi:protease Do-like 10, mitochondrial [Iris pallida]|uniref:Protease Do-like 10, mitochondrial n=1 Tax=Iris pallida TaxID=29817 RepID=A0AAX6E150_IRIPA|nr:protease Do-like 10, mitochondrial [Iris pallida]
MSKKGHLKVLTQSFIDPRREGLRRGPGPAATGVPCHRLVVGWAGVLCYGRNLVSFVFLDFFPHCMYNLFHEANIFAYSTINPCFDFFRLGFGIKSWGVYG